MWKIIPISLLQSLLLSAAQVFLKVALTRMPTFSCSRHYLLSLLSNWPLAMSGALFALASLLWMYIVKTYPLSTAYPLVSLSFVFGMLVAMLLFHEQVSVQQWVGVMLIVVGCILIAK